MPQKLVVGPLTKGLRNDVTAFNIDNESFPTLINAYQWRGRVKRKRGTSLLGRLTRFFNNTATYTSTASIVLNGSGQANILTGFGLEVNGNLVPGEVVVGDITTGEVYTDPSANGILVGSLGGSGTVNYSTGLVTITGGAGHSINITILYYPDLPVMGLEDLVLESTQFPGTLAFDTTYSYNISTAVPYNITDVSFYKNPPTGFYPGYIQKSVWNRLTWNGQDYQQFWTVNYQGALWATNGMEVPFDPTNIGMQFKPIVTVAISAGGPPAIAILEITGHGLVVGDFLYINEVVTTTGINFQTGYVIAVPDANHVTVEFPYATIAGAGNGGIAQYLTNRSDTTKDCIRWYDGDPTSGVPNPVTFVTGKGWVNFMPPLSQAPFSIADLPPAIYYLVGSRLIIPFKDRLLFLGPVIQSSSGSPIYLQDTIIFSQNGTPYYTSSFSYATAVQDPTRADITFNPILVPVNQTATAPAWFEDSTGFGGFLSAGISQPIITTSTNEDVLILGFATIQTRLIYTGNDIIPFNLFVINSELGSGSTFSAINMDQGVMTRGTRGFIISGQTQVRRIDLEIPDEVFEISLLNNGSERLCAQRDFINEWAYFTYPVNSIRYNFPTQTLQYNYRDDSWALFYESYTTYGAFRKQSGFIWSTVGLTFASWEEWNKPWNAGSSTLLQSRVIAGNQQGFVLVRDEGTAEGNSLTIRSIVADLVTCIDHCLNEGDFIQITGAVGAVGPQVNGRIFSVDILTKDTFIIGGDEPLTSAEYLGGGLIKRLYIPFIQTKQFPSFWDVGRKTRIGTQQYLLTKTNTAQIQLLIFLSQNEDSPYNTGGVVPDPSVLNNSLIYSTVLFTSPESTNLGLTAPNVNLQMPTGRTQSQIWHRINTSLIGDTIQLGFTISDAQMRALFPSSETFAITGASQATNCVLTCTGNFSTGTLIYVSGIVGMTELNNRIFYVVSSTTTEVTIFVDSTLYTLYESGGTAVRVAPDNQFAEIELHAFNMDISPSQLLS